MDLLVGPVLHAITLDLLKLGTEDALQYCVCLLMIIGGKLGQSDDRKGLEKNLARMGAIAEGRDELIEVGTTVRLKILALLELKKVCRKLHRHALP